MICTTYLSKLSLGAKTFGKKSFMAKRGQVSANFNIYLFGLEVVGGVFAVSKPVRGAAIRQRWWYGS